MLPDPAAARPPSGDAAPSQTPAGSSAGSPAGAPSARPARGAELVVEVVAFGDRGKSIARLDLPTEEGTPDRGGYVVFVPGAVPGDHVRVRIAKRKKGYAEARVLELVRPSPLRVVPRCPYAEVCGGCTWQHLAYPAQLEMKREAVERSLTHAGSGGLDLGGVPVRDTIGAERDEGSGGVYYYRNKMEFSFSAQRWLTDAEIATDESFDRHFALGLHVPGRFDKVLDLKTCFLQSEWSARLVNGIRDLARHEGWEPWHVREHRGWLRHLVIRTSANTEDRMVNLVTWTHDPERLATVTAFLRLGFPEATTFVNTVNEGLANTSYGEAHTVFGPGTVRDRIGAHTFEIGSNAFFQTNTRQAETPLRRRGRDGGPPADGPGLRPLLRHGHDLALRRRPRRRVVGVELVEEAVQNARAAASANGVANTTFVAGDMLRLFTPEFVAEHGRPDVLIVDPPRAGLHPNVVDQIADLRPERLVYVTCNPDAGRRLGAPDGAHGAGLPHRGHPARGPLPAHDAYRVRRRPPRRRPGVAQSGRNGIAGVPSLRPVLSETATGRRWHRTWRRGRRARPAGLRRCCPR